MKKRPKKRSKEVLLVPYELDEKVKCTETGLFGKIVDREWENGWTYTIVTVDGKYFYRDERELERR